MRSVARKELANAEASAKPPPHRAARQTLVAHTTEEPSQPQSLWLARQPARLPPPRAATPETLLSTPKS
jgi:hypothetical protein